MALAAGGIGGVPGATSSLEFAMLERRNTSLLNDCLIATELAALSSPLYTCCQEDEINSGAQYIAAS